MPRTNTFWIVFLLLVGASLRAQPTETFGKAATAFPAAWSGVWQGDLVIYHAADSAKTVPMALEIQRIDTSRTGRYTFGLVYGSKQRDWRPYELVPVDAAKGVWRIDEKNTIQMESYLHGPKLLCWFTVQANRILCTYEKTDDNTLVFEVCMGQEKAVSTTGGEKTPSENIPTVNTFPFSVFQRAVLKRTY